MINNFKFIIYCDNKSENLTAATKSAITSGAMDRVGWIFGCRGGGLTDYIRLVRPHNLLLTVGTLVLVMSMSLELYRMIIIHMIIY